MKKIKFLIFAVSFLATYSLAAAQEVKLPDAASLPAPNFGPKDQEKENPAVLANVGIYNAKISSQEGSKFKLYFEIKNEGKTQPGIRYGLKMFYPDNGFVSVTEKVYSDVFNLDNNESTAKEIEFIAPKNLDGKFNLVLSVQNDKGLALAMYNFGEVGLSGDMENSVGIDPKSCYLKVEGNDSKYDLTQGVDISPNENISLNCGLKNNFNKEVSVTPNFKIYYRTIYGNLIRSENKGQITLAAKETKTISLSVPKEQKPQAYDLLLMLLDSGKNELSNSIRVHYVIQGLSATVYGVRLDKDYYVKGDQAQVAVSWTGSADLFTDSRKGAGESSEISLEALLLDSSGSACSDSYVEKLEGSNFSGQKFLSVPITKDCANPKIRVSIKDKNGNQLDQAEYAIKSNQISQEKKNAANNWTIKNISFVLALLFALAVIVYVSIKKQKMGSIKLFIFFFFIFSALTMFVNKAEAGSTSWISSPEWMCSGADSSAGYYGQTYADYFNPGDTVRLSAWAGSWASCSNTDWVSQVGFYVYRWNGSGWDYYTQGGVYYAVYYSSIGSQSGNPWGDAYFNAGWTPGLYRIVLYGVVYGATGCGGNCHCNNYDFNHPATIDYTVLPPPDAWISAGPNPIPYGGASTISWSSNVNNNCWVWDDTQTIINGWGGTSGSFSTGSLTGNRGFHVQCYNSLGRPAPQRDVVVWVAAAPSASISANPNQIAYNSASTISWSSNVDNNCWVWDDTQTIINGWAGTSGSFSTGNLTAARGFHVQCYNSAWVPAPQADVTVGVGAAPCVPDSTCTSHAVNWGTCSASCGGGTATQTGTCDNGCSGTGSTSRTCTNNVPCCNCSSSENATQCAGAYTNSCGISCTGTKDCSEKGWREVSP